MRTNISHSYATFGRDFGLLPRSSWELRCRYWLRNNPDECGAHATFVIKAEGSGLSCHLGDCDETMLAYIGRSQGIRTMAGSQGVCWHCVSLDLSIEP